MTMARSRFGITGSRGRLDAERLAHRLKFQTRLLFELRRPCRSEVDVASHRIQLPVLAAARSVFFVIFGHDERGLDD